MRECTPKWGGPALPSLGSGTPRSSPNRPPLGSANDYKWQRASNLIAKGNDAVSIRLDSPQKAISSNNKKKKIVEPGVKTAEIDRKGGCETRRPEPQRGIDRTADSR